MLPIICIALVLRVGHATGGSRVYGDVEACGSGLLRHGLNFSTAWCTMRLICAEKKLEACINAEGGNCEHLLWHCLSDIPVATRHNLFYLESPTTTHNWLFSELPTFDRTQQTFSQMKKFSNLQVSVVTFQVGSASGLQIVFFLRLHK